MHSVCPQIPFPSKAVPATLTARNHILFCCASIGSYEGSGGPKMGWGPHSCAKWHLGTPITTNELAPVQLMGHTGLLVHCRNRVQHISIHVGWFSKVSQVTGSSRRFMFLKSKVLQLCMYLKREKQAKQENGPLHSLKSWTTLEILAASEHPAMVKERASHQKPNKTKGTNSSSTAFPWLCPSTSQSRCQRALAPGIARDQLHSQLLESWQGLPAPCPLGSSAPALTASFPGSWTRDQPLSLNN